MPLDLEESAITIEITSIPSSNVSGDTTSDLILMTGGFLRLMGGGKMVLTGG